MKKLSGILFVLALTISTPLFAAYPEEYPIYLRMLGFSKNEVQFLQKGRMVTHSIENRAPGEFGIIAAQVYNVPVYFFRDFYRYTENYASLLNFEQIGKFKQNSDLNDLKPLLLSDDDLREFLRCRSGACDMALTPEEAKKIPPETELASPDREAIADVYRQILLDRLKSYREKGIQSFTSGETSIVSAALVQDHLRRFPHVQAYFPLVQKHILEYPNITQNHGEEFFFWTKERLGTKPIISLRHVFSQRVGEDYIQVSILIYSSHSFLSSISVTHLINYSDRQVPRTLVVTEQRTLTDLHGNIIKSLGRNVLRSNLEKRVASWIKFVGKTMEDRYLDDVFFRNFPYGLVPRDQR